VVTPDIAQLESWLAAHEVFARTLRENDEPKRLIRRYCDRVVRMRGRLTVLKHPDEAPDRAQVLDWTNELDATVTELKLGLKGVQRFPASAPIRRPEVTAR
jgi:hypothetical protein